MKGYHLVKNYCKPEVSRNLISFGLKKNQENGYIKAPYYNGLGRHVCQLQRITLKFCKSGISSKGLRDFIETDLVDFAKKNQSVAIYLKPRQFKTAILVSEYLDGSYHWQSLHKMEKEKIKLWLDFMVGRSGQSIKVYIKENKEDWPSVQGPWNPFLNKPTEINISEFPNVERSKFIEKNISASEELINISKELKN